VSNEANIEVKIYSTLENLSKAAAEEFVRCAQEAIARENRFAVALAGGNTPRTMYEILAREYSAKIDWRRIHFFWGDERYVPHDDPQSNYRMAKELLLDALKIPVSNIHPMPTQFPNPAEAAVDYERTLKVFFPGKIPRFDLILLGVGTDGHTASLFPGHASLEEREAWVVPVQADVKPPVRLSLTLPAINSAWNIFFIAAGEEKHHVVQTMLEPPEKAQQRFPAAMVRTNGRLVMFLDVRARGKKR
jgi:6-phosphogluconolactonase